jgi:CRP/FNR family cyclic AMP-dependent transcriptional regulator
MLQRMEGTKTSRTGRRPVVPFDAQAFLDSAGFPRSVVQYARGDAIFKQGDVSEDVMYIQAGGIKLSVVSKTGREAVVAMLGPGDFFGEGCLAGQHFRMGTATAITPSTILLLGKDQLFNSSEKRLARTLLLLARYGSQDKPIRTVPRMSQETLAEMIGTTRSRVNFFLNKFKKLGFIEYAGELPIKINSTLLSVVLHE